MHSTQILYGEFNKTEYNNFRKPTATEGKSCVSWLHATQHKIFQEVNTHYITRIECNSENVIKLIQHNNITK
jgi:hypothetical protein